ncbi:MAG: hypothetical protein DRG78_14355 [Epsilonproteobacteria bacterium]|nr:MAG: hypothetical protein DRG78_14355 [Campylobacterota bacterium]
MNLENINLTKIEKSTITVLHPFIYDKQKILNTSQDNIVKLKSEYLKDFLPYTRNFFGNYHLDEEETKKTTIPCILKYNLTNTIEFTKDTKIKDAISIDDIQVFVFEKSIAILSVKYKLPDNLSDEEYLYYHQKLSMLDKRSKQNLKTSNQKEFKYYFEFIEDLISPYLKETENIFNRSNMYTYNLLVANCCTTASDSRNFLEPLTQYRAKLDTLSMDKVNANFIQQTSNINTLSNENVVVHIAIKTDDINNDFIDKEFFNKYQNNHFLTYIITLYQVSKMEQLVVKAFLKEVDSQDLRNMREIKTEILHFISNGNFTKISNNSIRNNLYKFYRKSFDIKDLMEEIDTISDKLTNKLENIQQDKQAQREKVMNLFLALLGIGLSIVGLS